MFRIFGEGQGGKKSKLVLFNLLLFCHAYPFCMTYKAQLTD